ncbi:MAG: citrate lyase acyl carrier protein, partial [Lachnospiraceae bacterium]|nr:citrate lyase acyl carrier protein [Lachnospiraceae bacterium]
GKIEMEVESVVINQYGESIKKDVLDTLKKFDVTSCKINVLDRGALPQVIKARVETAIMRSQGGNK